MRSSSRAANPLQRESCISNTRRHWLASSGTRDRNNHGGLACLPAPRLLNRLQAPVLTALTASLTARDEFTKTTAGEPYVSPLPADVKPPVSL